MVQDDEDNNANSLDKNMAGLGDCFPSLEVWEMTSPTGQNWYSIYEESFFTGKTAGHS